MAKDSNSKKSTSYPIKLIKYFSKHENDKQKPTEVKLINFDTEVYKIEHNQCLHENTLKYTASGNLNY